MRARALVACILIFSSASSELIMVSSVSMALSSLWMYSFLFSLGLISTLLGLRWSSRPPSLHVTLLRFRPLLCLRFLLFFLGDKCIEACLGGCQRVRVRLHEPFRISFGCQWEGGGLGVLPVLGDYVGGPYACVWVTVATGLRSGYPLIPSLFRRPCT